MFKKMASSFTLTFVASTLLSFACAIADETVGAGSAEGGSLLKTEKWAASDYFEVAAHRRVCEAIELGQIDAIEALIQSGIDVNASGKDGMTFLMWAYAANQIEAFSRLLKLGADPDQSMKISLRSEQTKHRRPKPGDCVTIVVFAEAQEKWRSVVVEAGGNLNAINAEDHMTVLLAAGGRQSDSLAVTREIICRNGIDLNFRDQFGLNALMYSAMRGDYECSVLLIEAGASVDCYDNDHQQLIDQVARRWINLRRRWEEQPLFKQVWLDDKTQRPAFEKLVFLLSERGFDLQTAMLGVMREKEMIDGVPYYEWRRRKRGHMDAGCPGLSNASDQK